ncbi:hypothetical protein MTR67_038639 [Solanum verrucosum]|uniref:Uncharacterized protein n=1 Tax=Solanum verrucosum TaxID=315347 RepID=A0AAF0UH69_SOLVR|nr:hypothetical protein MTR67_038639 [Solanum verrucosum]
MREKLLRTANQVDYNSRFDFTRWFKRLCDLLRCIKSRPRLCVDALRANVVAGALSRLSMGSVEHVEEERKELAQDVHRLARLGFGLTDMLNRGVLV